MATAKKSFGKRLVRGALYALAGLLLLSISCVLIMRWIDPITSAFILHARIAAEFSDDKKFSVHQQWTPLKKISPAVQLAVIASEDQKFPEHWGFDFASIDDALESRERGGRLRGASTISQQVAKNLFLWGGQNFLRKGIEAYFTVLLETLWPKHRILEMYLNVAQFGNGIYGVEAASRIYFGKHAARLNNEEAALLAAVLPNPLRLKVSAPSAYVRSRQTWIISQMAGLGGASYLHSFN